MPVNWTGLQLRISIFEIRNSVVATGEEHIIYHSKWKTYWHYFGQNFHHFSTDLRDIPHGPAPRWSCGVLMFEMLEGRPPFRDPNESRCCMENLMKLDETWWNLMKLDETLRKTMKLVDSNNNFPGFHFQMSLFSLNKNWEFWKAFPAHHGWPISLWVCTSLSFIPTSSRTSDRPIFGCRICDGKKTEEHSEEASSLIRQLLTPDLCERLKSAAEVKVLMIPIFAKNWRCKGAKWTVEQSGTWLLDVMMRWRKVGVEDLDLCLLQSEKPGFCVEKYLDSSE